MKEYVVYHGIFHPAHNFSVPVWWFKENVQPLLKGYSGLVVYANDFVMCFQNRKETEMVYELLICRIRKFGMKLKGNEIRLIEFE